MPKIQSVTSIQYQSVSKSLIFIQLVQFRSIHTTIQRQRPWVLQRNFRYSEVPFFVWEISAYLPYLHVFQFSIRPSALGIGAASFASISGQQTTDNRQQDFLSEEKTKSEQRYSGKPDGGAKRSRNAQNRNSELQNLRRF